MHEVCIASGVGAAHVAGNVRRRPLAWKLTPHRALYVQLMRRTIRRYGRLLGMLPMLHKASCICATNHHKQWTEDLPTYISLSHALCGLVSRAKAASRGAFVCSGLFNPLCVVDRQEGQRARLEDATAAAQRQAALVARAERQLAALRSTAAAAAAEKRQVLASRGVVCRVNVACRATVTIPAGF